MKILGTIASFKDKESILKAAGFLKKEGYTEYETYTPFPVHGMDEVSHIKPTKLPIISLVSGIIGLLSGLILQIWGSTEGYQVIVSGKPDGWAALFSFIPIVFELTILFAAFGTILGMFVLNNLGEFNHFLFEYEPFKKVTDDTFFLFISSKEKKYAQEESKNLLKKLNAHDITILEK